MTIDIPAFLLLSQDERKAAWKGRKLTVQGAGFRRIDKAELETRKRLQKEYDAQQKAKRAARLAAFLESRR